MFTNPRHRKFLVRSSALCAVALLGVACGGAEKDDPAGSASTAAGSDPLTAGLLGGKTFEEAEFEVEQQVQQCMTALGWEYTAVAPSAGGGGGGVAFSGADMDAFAAESGYGISTLSATGDATGAANGAGGASSNPNTAYTSKLSEAEQAAYFNDLYGAPPADADPSQPIALGGCYGTASEAVFGKGSFEKLDDQFAEVASRMQADERFVDAQTKWSECMSAAGYTYRTTNEPMDDFMSRLSALGSQPDPAALQALQTEELATAKADRACAKEVDLDEIQQEVYLEISEQVASGS